MTPTELQLDQRQQTDVPLQTSSTWNNSVVTRTIP